MFMVNNSRIRFLNLLVVLSIIMIYFSVYWHYWLIKMLGGYVLNNVLFIIVLFVAFAGKKLMMRTSHYKTKKDIFYLLLPLFGYVIFATISVFVNETGFVEIKRYLIYVYSPVIIFVSILGMEMFRDNENIKKMLNILIICGVLFSIYVFYVYLNPQQVVDMPVLETNRGEVIANSGAGYGVGDIEINFRYTIPGIGSVSQYAPVLVPLILGCIYFVKISEKRYKKMFYLFSCLFLSYCLAMTVSRGGLAALLVGLIFLIWHKWFNIREISLIVIFCIIAFVNVAKLVFYRLIITAAIYFPIDLSFMGPYAQDLTNDIRLRMPLGEKFSFLLEKPAFGIGIRGFQEKIGHLLMSNNYSIVFTAFGIFAGTFYIWFIVKLFATANRNVNRTIRNEHKDDIGIFLGAGLVSFLLFLVGAFTDPHFVWIWFGLTAAWVRNYKNGNKLEEV